MEGEQKGAESGSQFGIGWLATRDAAPVKPPCRFDRFFIVVVVVVVRLRTQAELRWNEITKDAMDETDWLSV